MRRIGRAAGITPERLEAVDKPERVVSFPPALEPPVGVLVFTCRHHVLTKRAEWLAECSKHEFSHLGCLCRPVKPRAALVEPELEPAVVPAQVRLLP